MLSIYRRHTRACTASRRQHDRTFWRCRCVIYAEGSLGGRYVRESLKTRDREKANRLILAAEERGSWEPVAPGIKDAPAQTVVSAVCAFLDDAGSSKGRDLAAPTLGKYRTLLSRLQGFCEQHSIVALEALTLENLRWFKETWPTGPRATGNNISRLRAFFKFAVDNEWIARNPAVALRSPKHTRDTQKLPFTEAEMTAILRAAEMVSLQSGSNSELVLFILLMRHTGLRISDAALLKADRIASGQLQLYTQKTGSWVSTPLEPGLLERLRAIPLKRDGFLFISGSTRLETITALWRRKISRVFKAAGIVGGHPHRFRHTFAVDLLSKGVDIKTVSILLGHSSVTITEKFYAAWITARQQALSEQVKRAWPNNSAA